MKNFFLKLGVCALALTGAAEALAQEQVIQLFAHRGSRFEYDENTLPAFKASYDAGLRGFETDIRMTRRRRAGDLARRDAGTSDALQARGGDDDGRRDPQGQDQPGQRPDLPARAGGLLRRQGQRIHRVRNEDEAGRELSRRAAARVLREGVQHGDGQETRQLALSVHVE